MLSSVTFAYDYVRSIELDVPNVGIVIVTPSTAIPVAFSPSNNTIKINTNGDFFDLRYSEGLKYQTGLQGNDLRAFMLMHELAHAAGVFIDDSLSTDAQDANNKALLAAFFNRALQKIP
jgi:hypothetical protein